MAAYLDDHPNRALSQQRPRRDRVSGVIVVHTAESALDALGEDSGAEGVARFISTRSSYGSYHVLADSDSVVQVARFEMTTYGDGTGSNDHAIHVSFACRAADWPHMSDARREAFLRNGARAAADVGRWLKSKHGITVPARRISRAESDRRVPGFISHGERDPGRRSDPGADFPWRQFLNHYAAEMGGNQQSEEDDMQLNDKFSVGPKREIDVEALYRYLHNETARQGQQLDRIVKASLDVDKLADAVVARFPKSQQIDRAVVKAGVLDALKEGTGE